MTLKEWRESKRWTQARLANEITERTGNKKVSSAHVSAWEAGTMPGADVGEAVRQITKGKVVW